MSEGIARESMRERQLRERKGWREGEHLQTGRDHIIHDCIAVGKGAGLVTCAHEEQAIVHHLVRRDSRGGELGHERPGNGAGAAGRRWRWRRTRTLGCSGQGRVVEGGVTVSSWIAASPAPACRSPVPPASVPNLTPRTRTYTNIDQTCHEPAAPSAAQRQCWRTRIGERRGRRHRHPGSAPAYPRAPPTHHQDPH